MKINALVYQNLGRLMGQRQNIRIGPIKTTKFKAFKKNKKARKVQKTSRRRNRAR